MIHPDTQTVELFCGTKSFSKVAADFGYQTFTVDAELQHGPDLAADILLLSPARLPKRPLVLWASPPCETFSVLSIRYYWNTDGTPKTLTGLRLVTKTVALIIAIEPVWWFIENPRGMLRGVVWFDEGVRALGGERKTITYCQYGDRRQKPTDIWTNAHWWKPRSACAPRSPCHEATWPSAKGSQTTGTVGLRGAVERARIPQELFVEIFSSLKGGDHHGHA